MDIFNLTQHPASPEQLDAGVIEPSDKVLVQDLLTFEEIPSEEEMLRRAKLLAGLALFSTAEYAMIGGAPFFMRPLEEALVRADIKPVYAFSRREVVEQIDESTGETHKTAVFRHLGFVGMREAYEYPREVETEGGAEYLEDRAKYAWMDYERARQDPESTKEELEELYDFATEQTRVARNAAKLEQEYQQY